MVGLRRGAMVVVGVVLAVVVLAVLALELVLVLTKNDMPNKICSTITALDECKSDEGPPTPGHGQVVYLENLEHLGNWWYPKSNSWISYSEYSTRTITETPNSWAKWIWHDCGDGYVCLESGRYPNYFLGASSTKGMSVLKLTDPKHDDRVRLKPVTRDTTWKQTNTSFSVKKFENGLNPPTMQANIYIPPRCEGYKQVAKYINPGPNSYDFKYTYESGITRTESHESTMSIGIELEIITAILSATRLGFFSSTWKEEKSTSVTEKDVHELSFSIPPRKVMIVWQKVAKYGIYEWRSSTFLPCEESI